MHPQEVINRLDTELEGLKNSRKKSKKDVDKLGEEYTALSNIRDWLDHHPDNRERTLLENCGVGIQKTVDLIKEAAISFWELFKK